MTPDLLRIMQLAFAAIFTAFASSCLHTVRGGEYERLGFKRKDIVMLKGFDCLAMFVLISCAAVLIAYAVTP